MSIRKVFSSFKNQEETRERGSLSVEVLEERMMLSTVEIFAAGATGQENLELFIDGQFEQSFFGVGGDASSRQFERFVFETDQTLTPGDIGIGFATDAFDASIGLDRDLIVDRIVVDGVTVQAEDASTFSTGIFRDGGVTGPGFFETEVLNINGILTFADPPSTSDGGSGDRIEFDAFGTTGEEFVDILVNGQNVAFFGLENPGVTQTFSFTSDNSNISIEDVRLEFVNDLFDADRGIDRNVQIFEYRVIDGDTGQVETARTTDANVLNSGIFANGIGITEGFGAGGFIAGDFDGNGFVEIRSGGGDGSGDRIEFNAFGTTGEEIVDVVVNGQNVASFALDTPGESRTFSFNSNDPNISIQDVRLEFSNDLFDADRGIDRNVQILDFSVIDGVTGDVQRARTTDANVLNSGIYVNGVGITDGFGAGGLLSGNGFVEVASGGTGAGDRIEFDAFGSTGTEIVDVLVRGETVASFDLVNPGVLDTFFFTSDDPNISIGDIRLAFVNDLFDPANGIDRNVLISEFRVIDGETGQLDRARTTNDNVFNSGVFDSNTGTITQRFGDGGFLVGSGSDFSDIFVEIRSPVGDSGPLTADPSFQSTPDLFADVVAVGPGDRVAAVDSTIAFRPDDTPQVLIVDSAGVPLSSFGENGRVDVADLLRGADTGFDNPIFEVSDLEFFDDGSTVLVGNIRSSDAVLFETREPLILKLNPDGTLDESFSQQGLLTGTSLQLAGFPQSLGLQVAVDSQDRVVVFGINNDANFLSSEIDFVVSRLLADGRVDTSFGNNGNVFIPSFDNGAGFAPSRPIDLVVDDQGEITFGLSVISNSADSQIVVGRLLSDGSLDRGFGDSGFFIRGGFTFTASQFGFDVAANGVIAIAGDIAGEFIPRVTLLTPNGDVSAEVVLDTNSETGRVSGVSPLLIDQFGNTLITSTTAGDSVAVLQRVLVSGEIDFGFGDNGIVELGGPSDFELDLNLNGTPAALDSQGRLIFGNGLTRFVV